MKPRAPLKRWVRVRVPASTANLGPGYDVLGLALKFYNEVEIEADSNARDGSSGVHIEIRGEGRDSLPKDRSNAVWRAAEKVFSSYRASLKGVRFSVRFVNRIPLARGMGSSAVARLGGVLAANELCRNFLSREKVLNLAAGMEGHPDNVVPSLVGGLCVSTMVGHRVQFIRLDPPSDLTAVVCVPEFKLSTEKARSVIPGKILHRDAVFSVSRVSLLLAALFNRDYKFVRMAMEDRLHQNYRKKLVPGFDRVAENGIRAGALGVALSGAGPSMFAFAPRSKARAVGSRMEKGFLSAGKKAKSLVLDFDRNGAQVQGA